MALCVGLAPRWCVVFHIKWHLSFELFVTLRGWMGIVPTVLPATTHHRAVKGSYKRSELVPFSVGRTCQVIRKFTAVGAGHLFACGGFLGGLGHRSSTPQWWAHDRSATIVVIHLVMVSTRAVVSALVCGQSGPVLSVETSCGAAPTGVVK
jgi:hypothetical protein